jgi:hypothetical protein
MKDFSLVDHGSVWLLTPFSDAAHDWVDDNLPEEAMRFGLSIAVEPRYVRNIAVGIIEDQLTIE